MESCNEYVAVCWFKGQQVFISLTDPTSYNFVLLDTETTNELTTNKLTNVVKNIIDF